jgi:hypothetical protein
MGTDKLTSAAQDRERYISQAYDLPGRQISVSVSFFPALPFLDGMNCSSLMNKYSGTGSEVQSGSG